MLNRPGCGIAAVGGALSVAFGLLWVAIAYTEPLPIHHRFARSGPQPDFATYYAATLTRSQREGVTSGNDGRLIRSSPRSKLALLYIHGFGASRADGEYVVERLAAALSANAYLMRLPGHGSRMEDLEKHEFGEYLRASEEAFDMVGQLGERQVVIGTSLGGALATYLAATYPERVAALVVISPFYDFVGIGKLLNLPGGLIIARAVEGRVRNAEQPNEIASRIHPDYAKHWYTREYTSSLRIVRDLRRFIGRPELFARVRCPVLLLYDPADDVASVPAMLRAFDLFRSQAQSRRVGVVYGNHVLASAYVDTDKATIVEASRRFLEAVRDQP
jgi:pimeloyl-ACP methyl ester carboxylesterase